MSKTCANRSVQCKARDSAFTVGQQRCRGGEDNPGRSRARTAKPKRWSCKWFVAGS